MQVGEELGTVIHYLRFVLPQSHPNTYTSRMCLPFESSKKIEQWERQELPK